MENLARYVDKEEKPWLELIIRAYVLEQITQVANTTHEPLEMRKNHNELLLEEDALIF